MKILGTLRRPGGYNKEGDGTIAAAANNQTAFAGAQNDLVLESDSLWQRLATDQAGNENLTGIEAALEDGQIHIIANVGAADNIVLMNQNAGSVAANRFTSPTGADITLGPGDMTMIVYDLASTTWRIGTLN